MLSPTEKRSKRLKVLRACIVCRRKKTKCNGEKPCTGCSKANVECHYTVSKIEQQQQHQQHQQLPMSRLTPISPAPTHNHTPPTPSLSSSSSSSVSYSSTTSSSSPPYIAAIERLEKRVTVIEDMFQSFLASLDQRELSLRHLTHSTHSGRPSACGNMYHPRPIHASHDLNRRLKRQRDEDGLPEVVQLPPIHPYTFESSSRPAIRNLLNSEDSISAMKSNSSAVNHHYDASSLAAYPRIPAAVAATAAGSTS